MSDLIVDTDVVSFGFRQTDLFVEKYGPELQGRRTIVSFMTVAEIEYGMLARNWGQAKRQSMKAHLERHYVRYGVTRRVCEAWAELQDEARRQGRVLQTADGWIAATANVLGLPLVTHNRRDFECLGSLMVITFADS